MTLGKPLSTSAVTTLQNELRSRVDMTRSPKPSGNDGYLRIPTGCVKQRSQIATAVAARGLRGDLEFDIAS